MEEEVSSLSEQDRIAHAEERSLVAERWARKAEAVDREAVERLVADAALQIPEEVRPDDSLERAEAAKRIGRTMTLENMLFERVAFEVALHDVARSGPEGGGGSADGI